MSARASAYQFLGPHARPAHRVRRSRRGAVSRRPALIAVVCAVLGVFALVSSGLCYFHHAGQESWHEVPVKAAVPPEGGSMCGLLLLASLMLIVTSALLARGVRKEAKAGAAAQRVAGGQESRR